MILEPSQAERYFRIWFPLLAFVNEQRALVRNLSRRAGDGALRVEQAEVLRDALWDDNSLRAQFIAENPCNLSRADLDLVASWDDRVEGQFFVLRSLKRYSIFIGDDDQVFGVLGLYSPMEEIFRSRSPQITDAVLLPFEGRIVVDGLLSRYPISIGANIRRMLEHTYRTAKQAGAIITSLPA